MKTKKEIEFNVTRQDLFTKSGIQVERQAIVREGTEQVLGIVSPDYKLITHKQVLDKSIAIVERFEDLKFKSAITTKGGARMYATFESEKEYIIGNLKTGQPDNLKLRLILTNSYDGSLRYGFIIGAYRLVCKNGLRVGQDIFAVKQKHTSGLNIDGVMNSAKRAVKFFNENTLPKWKAYNSQEIEVKAVLTKIEKSLPERLFKEVSGRLEQTKRTTLWNIYNEFTYVLTHEEKFNKNFDRNDRVQRKVARVFEAIR